MRQILLFEYLHAHPQWYADAPPSMRREGLAMLLAMATDLAAIPEMKVFVAVCRAAAADLAHVRNVTLLSVNAVSEQQFVETLMALGPFDDVLPIAPESGGVLRRLVEGFRCCGQKVIAANNETIAVGSDKWKMFELLLKHQLPTIPTVQPQDIDRLGLGDGDLCVLKPTDGAGCDGIVRCEVKHLKMQLARNSITPGTIVQPFVPGRSCSVGIIGRGFGRPPVILPVATQALEWSNERPAYLGGCVPAELSVTALGELHLLLRRLLTVISVDCGYVGIDLLHAHRAGGAEWLITEINPRLCTSYLGYRRAAESPLAVFLLGIAAGSDPLWTPDTINFSCSDSGILGYT